VRGDEGEKGGRKKDAVDAREAAGAPAAAESCAVDSMLSSGFVHAARALTRRARRAPLRVVAELELVQFLRRGQQRATRALGGQLTTTSRLNMSASLSRRCARRRRSESGWTPSTWRAFASKLSTSSARARAGHVVTEEDVLLERDLHVELVAEAHPARERPEYLERLEHPRIRVRLDPRDGALSRALGAVRRRAQVLDPVRASGQNTRP
jgi:hypothetical protein